MMIKIRDRLKNELKTKNELTTNVLVILEVGLIPVK